MHLGSRHKSFHFITFFLYSINVVQKYIFYDFIKVYVISYPKLDHMFAGFGWLFWIFVYILAAQICAGQAGPRFKKVPQTQQSHDLMADKK